MYSPITCNPVPTHADDVVLLPMRRVVSRAYGIHGSRGGSSGIGGWPGALEVSLVYRRDSLLSVRFLRVFATGLTVVFALCFRVGCRDLSRQVRGTVSSHRIFGFRSYSATPLELSKINLLRKLYREFWSLSTLKYPKTGIFSKIMSIYHQTSMFMALFRQNIWPKTPRCRLNRDNIPL